MDGQRDEIRWSTVAARFVLGLLLGVVVWIGDVTGASCPPTWRSVPYFAAGGGVLAVLLRPRFGRLMHRFLV